MKEFEKQFPECFLEMIDKKDKWGISTYFAVNGPHK